MAVLFEPTAGSSVDFLGAWRRVLLERAAAVTRCPTRDASDYQLDGMAALQLSRPFRARMPLSGHCAAYEPHDRCRAAFGFSRARQTRYAVCDALRIFY
jgi:hypothetical protein